MKYLPIWINPDWKPDADEALYSKDGFYKTADPEAMARTVMRGMKELGLDVISAIYSKSTLDYGSGTGALAARLVAKQYDPITAPIMPDGLFDLITCVHVIEHAEDPVKLIRDIKAKLSPFGTLCMVAHNAVGLPNKRARRPWHRWVFGRSLVALIESEGFRVTRRLTWGGCTAKAKWIKEPVNWVRKQLGMGDVQMILAEAK